MPGRNLDRSNSTPPTGATSRRRPPRGAFPIPRPLAVVDYCASSGPYETVERGIMISGVSLSADRIACHGRTRSARVSRPRRSARVADMASSELRDFSEVTVRNCSSSTTSVDSRGPPPLPRRAGYPWTEQMARKMLRNVEIRGVHPARNGHSSNAGHSSRVPGGDARRATPPDPRPARWGLASWCQLDPSHPALVTREDPGVEPCLIPCGPSWSLSRLPAGPVLRSPLRERAGMGSTLHA